MENLCVSDPAEKMELTHSRTRLGREDAQRAHMHSLPVCKSMTPLCFLGGCGYDSLVFICCQGPCRFWIKPRWPLEWCTHLYVLVCVQIKDKLTALALGGLHGDIVPEAPPRSRISSSDWAAVEAGELYGDSHSNASHAHTEMHGRRDRKAYVCVRGICLCSSPGNAVWFCRHKYFDLLSSAGEHTPPQVFQASATLEVSATIQ